MALRKESSETLPTEEFVTRVRVVSGPLLIITILGVVAGVAIAIMGVILVLNGNTDAQSVIDFLGFTINTTSVGVACLGIGAIVTILTIRRVLQSFDHILKK